MQGLEYLASKLTFASFSAKTCSFYLGICEQLLQQYADNTIFQEFALRTEYMLRIMQEDPKVRYKILFVEDDFVPKI